MGRTRHFTGKRSACGTRKADGASLALRFARQGGRTALVANRHRGPARVQRPFYPEGTRCAHAYLLHPSSGYVGGDTQTLDVGCGEGALALLTTPAAAKYYRSSGPCPDLRVPLAPSSALSFGFYGTIGKNPTLKNPGRARLRGAKLPQPVFDGQPRLWMRSIRSGGSCAG